MAQKTYTLSSPDGQLKSNIVAGSSLTFDISKNGAVVLSPSTIALEKSNGTVWGKDVKIQKATKTSVNGSIKSPLYRTSEIKENYNALSFKMKGGWSLEFRAYNDGIAYRFVNNLNETMAVKNEVADFCFPSDAKTIVPYVKENNYEDMEEQYLNSFENTYTSCKLSELNPKRLIFLPLVVESSNDVKVCLTEVNVDSYPGMYLWNTDGKNHLTAHFAAYPSASKQGGHNMLQMIVSQRENYIAKVDGTRTFPWRVAIVGSDTEIAASDLTYLLADESKLSDISWIKPGKVAWEWWNDWNITNVDFKSGVNNATYKHYIDFAGKHGIEYVILDEGWAVNKKADLFQVVPEINLEELVAYGKERNVGLILWAGYHAFERDMEKVCQHYSQMGIKGFKVDFMDRDDQEMTAFNYRAAEVAAKYNLMLDLHGTSKPAGLNRTWPNVINFEGVAGLENMKWSSIETDQMEYDTTIPFIRQAAGPMDYTQGAMRNATKDSYTANYSQPMSQGTRCHQLALYIILDSPLLMLCDTPSNYMKELECTDFISTVPTVWDETRILDGKMGEFVITAKRSGSTWYIGGITNWDSRQIKLNLASLGIEADSAVIFKDGVNADRNAEDYKKESISISNKTVNIELAPGGGFVMIVK